MVDSDHICLAVVSLDFALTKDKNYYLKECKYIEKKVARHITQDRNIF